MAEDLLAELARRPGSFEFLPAVRAALAWARRRQGGDAGKVPGEGVRFRGSLSLSFPVGPVEEVEVDPEQGRVTLVTHVGTLTGVAGCLPRFYTALLKERERRRDHALRAFLDIFNNRWAWFAYELLEKYSMGPPTGRPDGVGVLDRLVFLLGRGAASGRQPALLHPASLLPYAGLWAQQPRNVVVLEQLLSDFLPGMPVAVRQFVGRWAVIPAEERGSLGDGRLDGTTAIGERMWDRQGTLEIRIGPVDRESFLRFQRDGDLLARVGALVREYVGDRLLVRLVALLRADEIPECRLARSAEEDGPRLGQDLCLGGPGCCEVMVGRAIEI